MNSRYRIKVEPAFKSDYKRVMRAHPHLKSDFAAAVDELAEHGAVSEAYAPHRLSNAGGNYNNYIDFHLSDGLIDVIVLYMA